MGLIPCSKWAPTGPVSPCWAKDLSSESRTSPWKSATGALQGLSFFCPTLDFRTWINRGCPCLASSQTLGTASSLFLASSDIFCPLAPHLPPCCFMTQLSSGHLSRSLASFSAEPPPDLISCQIGRCVVVETTLAGLRINSWKPRHNFFFIKKKKGFSYTVFNHVSLPQLLPPPPCLPAQSTLCSLFISKTNTHTQMKIKANNKAPIRSLKCQNKTKRNATK